MHLSDLVHCDGRTLSEDLLKASGRLVTKVTFPKEKTTRNDKSLWRQFLDTLNDGCNTLLEPLGEYISPPYTKLHWQYNQVSINLLCSNFDSTKHNVYEQQTIERRIRSGPVYERTRTVVDPVEGSHYTHVISNGDDRVKLHSRVSKYVESPLSEKFLDTLISFTNQNMLDFMPLDDDREWISKAIHNNTLDVAHDGSYQPEIYKDSCFAAVWVQCRTTEKQTCISFAEKLWHASSYRSEILGAIAAQLIVRATTRNVPAQYQEVPTYCDNKGVLNHVSQAEKELKERQA